MSKTLLLGSGGTNKIPERVNAWKEAVKQHSTQVKQIIFIPYAVADYDQYEKNVQEQYFSGLDVEFLGIHRFDSPLKAIEQAQALYVGGGNTFRLLYRMQEHGLLDVIREKVLSGMPYIGISAGTNVACPTIANTNDMPIMCPPKGFNALNLIPFQINAHYTEGKLYYGPDQEHLQPYGGESRDDRLREYHEENDTPVLAMAEGAYLKVNGHAYTLGPVGYAKLLKPKQDAIIFKSNAPVKID
ncbi:MAG TPA: dipeptidase PepE [Oligoflexia bacterium]|nr:dipeptidase PepE [Oligoflexia bacterium]HMR25614.1 dipeptidase PepE [Oligoflexia bacterium]